jgi:hypothetical protein
MRPLQYLRAIRWRLHVGSGVEPDHISLVDVLHFVRIHSVKTFIGTNVRHDLITTLVPSTNGTPSLLNLRRLVLEQYWLGDVAVALILQACNGLEEVQILWANRSMVRFREPRLPWTALERHQATLGKLVLDTRSIMSLGKYPVDERSVAHGDLARCNQLRFLTVSADISYGSVESKNLEQGCLAREPGFLDSVLPQSLEGLLILENSGSFVTKEQEAFLQDCRPDLEAYVLTPVEAD